MRHAFAALAALLLSVMTAAAQGELLAQTQPDPGAPSAAANGMTLPFGQPVGEPAEPGMRSPVVTVDQDRLFAESAWGRRVAAEVERRSAALAAENRAIEEELVAEEQELTDLRPEMEPDAFRERAAAFDDKVQRLRSEQDAKAVALAEFREDERQRFFAAVGDVLTEVVTDRGAVAVLDRRAIILSIESIDITDEVMARVDVALGDGAGGRAGDEDSAAADAEARPPQVEGTGDVTVPGDADAATEGGSGPR